MNYPRKAVEIFIPGLDAALSVDYTYYEGCPAVFYLRNGDPGHPKEPSEIEDLVVRIGESGDISEFLNETAFSAIYNAIDEHEREHKYDGIDKEE